MGEREKEHDASIHYEDTGRASSMSVPIYRFGEFALDCGRFELSRNGRPIRLERKPMELLILLAERDGQLVSREEIAERLWDREVFVDIKHGINTAVRKIRQTLRDDPRDPRFIRTVTGKGYRLIATVSAMREAERAEGSENRARTISVLPSEVLIKESIPLGARTSSRSRPGIWVVLALLGAMLACAIALGVLHGRTDDAEAVYPPRFYLPFTTGKMSPDGCALSERMVTVSFW
jgi:DNA-binding winged helix-turn-helix (wHTH) protein